MPLSGFHSHERKVHLQRDEEANVGELPRAKAMCRLAAFVRADPSWLNLGGATPELFEAPFHPRREHSSRVSFCTGNVGSGSHQTFVAVITTIQATNKMLCIY